MTSLIFVNDHRDVLGKLMLGRFLILPWEKVEDHEVWGEDLIKLSVELDVEVHRHPIPRKSLTIIFHGEAVPDVEDVQDAIDAIELDRFMNRELGKLIVPGHRVSV